jgi:hypothetical protein
MLVDDYRLRRDIATSEEITTDYGTAREAGWSDLTAAGMDDPAGGNFLGLYVGQLPVFAPSGTPFSLIEMPPGAGKTINYVIGSILHRAKLSRPLIAESP